MPRRPAEALTSSFSHVLTAVHAMYTFSIFPYYQEFLSFFKNAQKESAFRLLSRRPAEVLISSFSHVIPTVHAMYIFGIFPYYQEFLSFFQKMRKKRKKRFPLIAKAPCRSLNILLRPRHPNHTRDVHLRHFPVLSRNFEFFQKCAKRKRFSLIAKTPCRSLNILFLSRSHSRTHDVHLRHFPVLSRNFEFFSKNAQKKKKALDFFLQW